MSITPNITPTIDGDPITPISQGIDLTTGKPYEPADAATVTQSQAPAQPTTNTAN
jgi:hypothetical protein